VLVSTFHHLLESTHKHYDPEIRYFCNNHVKVRMKTISGILMLQQSLQIYHNNNNENSFSLGASCMLMDPPMTSFINYNMTRGIFVTECHSRGSF
jgi:hypothetical protein